MIIRIIGQGQYQVKSALFDELNEIDDEIVTYVEKGDEEKYREGLAELIGAIVSEGEMIDPKQIVVSDVIVPPADMSLEEARQVFRGTGIFVG